MLRPEPEVKPPRAEPGDSREVGLDRLLDAAPLLAPLTGKEREAVAQSAGFRSCPQGAILRPEEGPFLILRGRGRLCATDVGGAEDTLAHLSPGDLCFEDRLFDGSGGRDDAGTDRGCTAPRQAGEECIRVDVDLEVARIDPVTIRRLRDSEPDLDASLAALAHEGVREFLWKAGALIPLPSAGVRALLSHLEAHTFLEGDVLAEAGKPAEGFSLICSGRARREASGRGSSPRFLGRGDWFGEASLVLGGCEPTAVAALTDGWRLHLGATKFERLCAGAPDLRRMLSSLVAVLAAQGRSISAPRIAPRDGVDGEGEGDGVEEEFLQPGAPRRPIVRGFRRVLGRYPYRRPTESLDCGPAALAMVAEHHGRNVPLGRLRQLAGVSRQGCSLYGLAQAAEAVGLRARGVQAEFCELRTITLPAIAHVGTNHFVVIYEATERDVLIADPATGMETVRRRDFERLWKGILLLLAPTIGPAVEEGAPPSGLRRFASYLRPHRGVLTEVFLAAVALHLLGLVMPLVTQTVIDRVLVHTEVSLLGALLGAAMGAALFSAGIGVLRSLLLYNAVRSADRALVADFHHRLFGLPLQFFATRKVGDILVRFSDNQKVRQFVVFVLFGVLLDGMFGTIYLAVVVAYDPRLALIGLLPVPLLAAITLGIAPAYRRIRREMVHRTAETQSALVESISAVKTIKAIRAEHAERRRFETLFDRTLAVELKSVRLSSISGAIGGLVVAAGAAAVLWYGAHRVLDGALTLGALVAVSALLAQVMAPAVRLIGFWERFQETAVSLERLADVFDAEPEEPQDVGLVDLPPMEGHLRFDDVTFAYEKGQEPALERISLEIGPGERVALVGRSGAGKSTFANLVLRLYEPDDGSIQIDGHDIRSVSARSLRSQIGFVPQTVDLFSGTLSENIAVGRDLLPDQIVAASRAAGAHEFIARLRYGYETVVGERGMVRFSGGELQRISIARALAGTPRLLLLDEPTSALDAESEAAFLHALHRVLDGRTVILLAHRLSFARKADRIIVLDRGRLVEQGAHDDLLGLGGIYAALWKEHAG